MNSKILLTTSILAIVSIGISFGDNSTTNGTSSFQSIDDQVRFTPRPIVKFWKLQKEASRCLQMTWSKDQTSSGCLEKNCHEPLFTGGESPNVENFRGFCKLSAGQTCVKYVVYDSQKSPVYIARYCGQGTFSNDGKTIENSCRKDSYSKLKAKRIEVCFCNDKNSCNSAGRFGFSVISVLFFFCLVKLF